MNYKRIGKAIKERMVELGISEEDLARDCNIDLALVNNIIIGEEVVSIEVLTLISISFIKAPPSSNHNYIIWF